MPLLKNTAYPKIHVRESHDSSTALPFFFFFQERMGFGTFPSSYLVANCQGEERLQDPFPTSQDLSAPSTCWQQGAECEKIVTHEHLSMFIPHENIH